MTPLNTFEAATVAALQEDGLTITAKGLGLESLDKLKEMFHERISSDYARAARDKVKRQLLDKLDALYDALHTTLSDAVTRSVGQDAARLDAARPVSMRVALLVEAAWAKGLLSEGQIARLLTEVGELGVNLEDMRLEHSPGAPIGIVELAVTPEVAGGLEADLQHRGWRVA